MTATEPPNSSLARSLPNSHRSSNAPVDLVHRAAGVHVAGVGVVVEPVGGVDEVVAWAADAGAARVRHSTRAGFRCPVPGLAVRVAERGGPFPRRQRRPTLVAAEA